MDRTTMRWLVLPLVLTLAACGPQYTLVTPQTVAVTPAKFKVTPGQAWNRAPKGSYDSPQEENWTENGPLLDNITFIGGLADGKAVTKQRKKANQKVPVFRSTMNGQDLADMIESYYRIKADAKLFETTGVAPATFLGADGFRFDYDYVGGDDVKRRGRAVGAIVNGKLYLAVLDGTRLHYFDAALPDFDRMVGSAHL